MRQRFRSTRWPALAVAAATLPMAVFGGGGHVAMASAAPFATQGVSAAPEIPDNPAGRQLRWLLEAASRTPLAEAELKEHINATYLAAVTVDAANATLKGLAGLELKELTEATATAISGTGAVSGETLVFRLHVDKDGKIDNFSAQPPPLPVPPSPTSWADLDQRLRKAAPNVGLLAAEIDSRGRCVTAHAVAPRGRPEDKVQPLGSIFKLYVLGAVAQKIRDGELSWNTKLTIKPEWKSLSEGGLTERPDNSTTTVREAATLMIAISDNTAADILIHTVGRKAVEATVRQWSGHARLNIPFLTTRELFLLKGVNHPEQAKTYAALDTAGKRAYLKKTVAKQSLADIVGWTTPREIGTLEWFGSPRDVCRAYAGLARLTSKPLHEALSANDIGLQLPPKKWPAVWAKGGSELGVLDLSYFARTAKGRSYVVTVLTNNPEAGLDERTLAPELISLSRGAFAILAAK